MRRALTATGCTHLRPRDLAVASSRRHLNRHQVHSAATPVTGISALCRLRDHSYVVGSTSLPPVTTLVRRISYGNRGTVVSGQQPGNAAEISEGSTFSSLREVIMTMSEYEERFRPPAPSLHQTFAEVRRPNRGGRRSRRLWVTAALVGVMTITSRAALHHSSHTNGSPVSKSGTQACDFIYR
jgi:hypothetical protein